jgi:hypothetical protein
MRYDESITSRIHQPSLSTGLTDTEGECSTSVWLLPLIRVEIESGRHDQTEFTNSPSA